MKIQPVLSHSIQFIAKDLVGGVTEDRNYSKKQIEADVNFSYMEEGRVTDTILNQIIDLMSKRSVVNSSRVKVTGKQYKVKPSVLNGEVDPTPESKKTPEGLPVNPDLHEDVQAIANKIGRKYFVALKAGYGNDPYRRYEFRADTLCALLKDQFGYNSNALYGLREKAYNETH